MLLNLFKNWFGNSESQISAITARQILDSRGEKTIEVKIKLKSGIESSASVPQGKSRGSGECVYVPVDDAIKNIEEIISPALSGHSVLNQNEIDQKLLKIDGTDNKSKLGANSILGVSIAVARAAASFKKVPLWTHIRSQMRSQSRLSIPRNHHPRLFVNLINGGAHAKNKLAFQEYIAIINGQNFSEMIAIEKSIHAKLEKILTAKFGSDIPTGDEGGFSPDIIDTLEPFDLIKEAAGTYIENSQVELGTDVAGENAKLEIEERYKLFEQCVEKHKLIYIEDPFNEDDFDSFAKLTSKYGFKTIITGDDLTVTNSKQIILAERSKSINGVIIKPNQIGSVSEAIKAVVLAQSFGWKIIASHRSGETNDSFIADFAYAVGAFGLKLGVPTQPVRKAKYDRLIEIDNEK